jgi:hypothetical protein
MIKIKETLFNKYAVNQLGYYVEDLEKAAKAHAALFGSGPFYYLDPVTQTMNYRGKEIENVMQTGGADKILDLRRDRRSSMHSQEQRQKAVELFMEIGSCSTVVNTLGYGSRWSIERWCNDFKRQGFVKESRAK